MINKQTSAEVAKILLEINAVKLSPEQPFTWASGWRSPIYCDNRVILSVPAARSYIKRQASECLKQYFPGAEAIVGVATAGIAMGAYVADLLELPFAYARPKPKEHGLRNMLEGRLEKNVKVVVFEDLISTGKSSLNIVEYLRASEFEVLGMQAIFTYNFQIAADNFQNAHCSYVALSCYEDLVSHALKTGYVAAKDMERLNAWRLNPSGWE